MKRHLLKIVVLISLFVCSVPSNSQNNQFHYDVGSFEVYLWDFGLYNGDWGAFIYYPKYNNNSIYSSYADTRIYYIDNNEYRHVILNQFMPEYTLNIKSVIDDKTAVSDLDTRTDFFDRNTEQYNDRPFIRGLFNTYGFSEEFRNDFIIFEYILINEGIDTVKGLCLHRKFCVDISPVEQPEVKRFYKDDHTDLFIGNDAGFIPDEKIYIAYAYDGDSPDYSPDDAGGPNGECPGYFGTCSIYSPATEYEKYPEHTPAYYFWGYQNIYDSDYAEIIQKMENNISTYMQGSTSPTIVGYIYIGWGPYNIAPGDTAKIVFAFGVGEGLDNMVENFKWARRTYRSGWKSPILASPEVTYNKRSSGIELTWNVNEINYINPFTERSGFSGYKIYKTEYTEDYLRYIDNITLLDTIPKEEINSSIIEFLDTDVEKGKKYVYTVVNYLEDTDGKYYESSKRRWVTIVDYNVPDEHILYQNYPNPFNSGTKIKFELKKETEVILKIYNILGQEIKTLLNNQFNYAGPHSVFWDGTNNSGFPVSSGVYIYRFKAVDFIRSKKLVLLK
ncbi:T9SS type A sorting domain-containing protein [candidate division KSB1 bacterium]